MFHPHAFKNELKCDFTPVIYFTPDAFYDQAKLVSLCDKEIGWVAEVTRNKMSFVVDKIHLLDQDVNYTTTEITPEGFAKFAQDLMVKNPDEAVDILNSIRYWGHSHVHMACGSSTQDDAQMKTLSDDVDDFFIRSIANKKGELVITLYLFDLGLVIEDCQWQLWYPNYDHQAREEHWKKEIEEHVKTKKHEYPHAQYSPHMGNANSTHRNPPISVGAATTSSVTPELEKEWDNYLLECAGLGAS